MRNVKLMSEYGCHPIWIRTSEDEIFEMVDLKDFKDISENLKKRIDVWDDFYQRTYNETAPQESGFKSMQEDEYRGFIS